MAERVEARFCLRCGTPLQLRERFGVLRPVCPACGWTYFPDPKVATAVLVVQDGKILLVQRRQPPFAGQWTLPAGFVDAGEDPAQAAVRECAEETGLHVCVTTLLDVVSGREHPRGADFMIVWRAEVTGGQMQAQDDAGAVAWFPADGLPPLAFAATRRVVKRFFLAEK